MSIFEGKLDEIPEISIDYFLGTRITEESTAYFLSHCHTDHMKGLSSSDFQLALSRHENTYLYTSYITRCILKNDHTYRHLTPRIRALPSQKSCRISIPSLSDLNASVDLHVTLIPAGHCPGSVMFFFESEEGNVLYTGDFRLSLDNIYSISELHQKNGEPKLIRSCYLDATFFDEMYWTFPKREESWKKICDLIKDWLGRSLENEVLIDVPANYEAEHIFCEIKREFDMKVHVSDDKFNKFMSVREISKAITNDNMGTRVHACYTNVHKRYRMPCKYVEQENFLRIRVSCMWYTKEYAMKGDIKEVFPDYTCVCYACHCSYEELLGFLKHFLPEKVTACAISRDRTKTEVENKIENILKEERSRRKMSPNCSEDSNEHRKNHLKRNIARKLVMSSPRKKRPLIRVPEDESSEESFQRNTPSHIGEEEQDTSENTISRPHQSIPKFSLERLISHGSVQEASIHLGNTDPGPSRVPMPVSESGYPGNKEQNPSSSQFSTEPVSPQVSMSSSGSGDSGDKERKNLSYQVKVVPVPNKAHESTSGSGESGNNKRSTSSIHIGTAHVSPQVSKPPSGGDDSGEKGENSSSTHADSPSPQVSQHVSESGDPGNKEQNSSSTQFSAEPVSPQVSMSTSGSGDSGDKEQKNLSYQVKVVPVPNKAHENVETLASSYESDFEPSPSLLPQFSSKFVNPMKDTRRNESPECLMVCEGESEKEIEVITLSSDESPDIFTMDRDF